MGICLFDEDVCVIGVMTDTWIEAISVVCRATIRCVYKGAAAVTYIGAIAGAYIEVICTVRRYLMHILDIW